MKLTKHTELRRIPERGSYDWQTISQILDAGFLPHVGFCVEKQSFVIPTLYGRDGERLSTCTVQRPVACCEDLEHHKCFPFMSTLDCGGIMGSLGFETQLKNSLQAAWTISPKRG
jgi:hypothetical protein